MSVLTDETSMTTGRQLLELHGEIKPEGHADAVMTVRWCVSPELTRVLKDRDITKPYVLITARPYYQEEDNYAGESRRSYQRETKRILVPLTQELAYVSFTRPGHHEVTACIVFNEEGKGRLLELDPLFLARGQDGEYMIDLFDYNGELWEGSLNRYSTSGRTQYSGEVLAGSVDSIEVFVPAELFAREYPQWLKDVTGKFFRRRPADQCSMRRRAIVSSLLLPVYLPFAYAVRLAQLAIGLWWGLRGLDLRSFWHPWRYGISDVSDGATSSSWFVDQAGYRRPWLLLLLNPVTPVIGGLILWGVGTYHVTRGDQIVGLIGWDWWQYFVLVALLQLGIEALLLAAIGLIGAVSLLAGTSLSSKLKANRERARRERRDEQRTARLQTLEQELNAMVCTNGGDKVSLEALPRQKRTVRLRYQETKRRVCKPITR